MPCCQRPTSQSCQECICVYRACNGTGTEPCLARYLRAILGQNFYIESIASYLYCTVLHSSYIGNQMLNEKELNQQSLLFHVSSIVISIYLLCYMACYCRAQEMNITLEQLPKIRPQLFFATGLLRTKCRLRGGCLCQDIQAGSQARAVQQEEGRFPTLPLLIRAGGLSFPGKGAVQIQAKE